MIVSLKNYYLKFYGFDFYQRFDSTKENRFNLERLKKYCYLNFFDLKSYCVYKKINKIK